jgi:hypothetical protein
VPPKKKKKKVIKNSKISKLETEIVTNIVATFAAK